MNLNDTKLWTAVITPMLDNGDVDYSSLESILNTQNDAKNGILILGSTGEALNLDEDESRKILEFTCDHKKSVPLMCGVGGINLKSTKKWVEYLNSLTIDCYLLVTPLYAKPGDEGQYEWFKELLDLSKKPCMLYNVPSRTGKDMSLLACEKLVDHKNFWSIKEASGSVQKFESYVKAAKNQRVYSGDDALLPEFSEVGAKGLVSVAANVWPKQTNLYVEKCLDGTLGKNDEDTKLWKDATESLFVASNPIPVKWLMSELKQIRSAVLRPPLTLNDMTSKEVVMRAHENIQNWFNNNK